MKTIFFLFSTLFMSNLFAQNLSDQLWDNVRACNSLLINEEGEADYDVLIDDAENGYLKISGSYPTCGCSCESTVGAYKTDQETYVFLSTQTWNCSWNEQFTATKNMNDLFPFDFIQDGFFSPQFTDSTSKASFHLRVEIPQNGTDTKVFAKAIPLGIQTDSESVFTFNYSEEDRLENTDQLQQIQYLARELNDAYSLSCIEEGSFSSIPEKHLQVIQSYVGDETKAFTSLQQLQATLHLFSERYALQTQVQHQWILLGWNASEASFYLKEKGPQPKQFSFLEFVQQSPIWMAVC
ncbi:hypothetical protein MG290_09880 [Flavobacterium sp. CBA20B-1]|uniref:hypothetical protein n=1 Tax=unclassified Flavobacterium TaxID=196869 RepID=UPI002224AC12|nr:MULTISPECIES: hypothetical protein [unclassified Flavobacterium]WCM41266.1 hypothetical protein MG290_09880 [Flavobacterium sp. CBA20B-1]